MTLAESSSTFSSHRLCSSQNTYTSKLSLFQQPSKLVKKTVDAFYITYYNWNRITTICTSPLVWSEKLGLLEDGAYLYKRIFWRFVTFRGKSDLSKGCWNGKRKLRVTTHFSEIIELKRENAIHCSVFQSFFFLELWLFNYLWKIHGYPQFYFWIPALAEIRFFPHCHGVCLEIPLYEDGPSLNCSDKCVD